jgi:hypothetical protein
VEGNLDVECAEHEARRGGEAALEEEVVNVGGGCVF